MSFIFLFIIELNSKYYITLNKTIWYYIILDNTKWGEVMNTDAIKARHTSIVIPNYELGSNESIERMLSVWNGDYYRFETIGFDYNENTKELLLPRGLDLNYVERAFQRPVDVIYKPDPFEPASMRLMVEPRSDIQRKSICFLLGEGDFEYTKRHSQLALNLDTGDGKTYCVIAALSFLKMKTMIICHSNRVKKQWINSMLKMTDIDKQFLCDIEGSSSIKKLMKQPTVSQKVFFINHSTIQSCAKKNGWGAVTALFQKLGIGLKVFDEAHLRFENMVKTDLYTNTKKTFYLTASLGRSNFRERKLFDLVFKNIAKYGIQTRNEKRKHMIYIVVHYNSRPNLDVRASMKGRHGLDRNRFTDYQISSDIFFDVLTYILNYFGDKEGKMLILSNKNNALGQMDKFIRDNFPDKTTGTYNSIVSAEEREKAIYKDIILSTEGSLGTGADIPDHRFNIVTIPYSSPITTTQLTGRLRAWEDKYSYHVELVDNGFPEVVSMFKKRVPVVKKRAFKMFEIKYDATLKEKE